MTRSRSRRPTADQLVAPGLRQRLEAARLEVRAWLRALDELHLVQELPPELYQLMELDADFAEALLVLDQPGGDFNWAAMTADTQASLAALPDAQAALLGVLTATERRRLTAHVRTVRAALHPSDAYLDIPGRDPRA